MTLSRRIIDTTRVNKPKQKQHMTIITHVKTTHYIDDTKNNTSKYRYVYCTFTGFPRNF